MITAPSVGRAALASAGDVAIFVRPRDDDEIEIATAMILALSLDRA